MGSSQSKPETSSPAATDSALTATKTNMDEPQREQSSSENGDGGGGGGGCPMKREDGSYSYDWKSLFSRHPHGSGGSRPLNQEDLASVKIHKASSTSPPQESGGGGGGGGCPVKHGKQQEYNVYSQPIDPTNQMPKVANQLPAPGQTKELSTTRVSSSISKGGAQEGATWTYPSPQMFYNALSRKGKLGDTKEEDMESIVHIHNNMNEKTWTKVLEWEEVLCGPDSEAPKLLKFMGRPADLSPKATLKHYLLGHPLPYDRHDWTVLRSDGTTVRYVIDYYHDESRADDSPESALPHHKDHGATPSLLVDVRPAIDSPLLVWNRMVTMPYAQTIAKTTDFHPLPLAPTNEMKTQVQESLDVWSNIQENAKQQKAKQDIIESIPEEEAVALAKNFSRILLDCQEATTRLQNSQSEDEHQKASLDLTICMSKIVCPLQHKTLVKVLGNDDENAVEAALDRVTSCVVGNTNRRGAAKEKFPHLFEK